MDEIRPNPHVERFNEDARARAIDEAIAKLRKVEVERDEARAEAERLMDERNALFSELNALRMTLALEAGGRLEARAERDAANALLREVLPHIRDDWDGRKARRRIDEHLSAGGAEVEG